MVPAAHDGRKLRGNDFDRCQVEVREGAEKVLGDIRLAFDQMAPLEEYTVEMLTLARTRATTWGSRDWKDYWSISDDSCASAACNELTMPFIPTTPPPAASEEEARLVHLRQIQAQEDRLKQEADRRIGVAALGAVELQELLNRRRAGVRTT